MKIVPGSTAFVTGAGSGMGRAMALRFARAGMKVAACDVRAEEARRTADTITAQGGEALALAADVSDLSSLSDAADLAERHFGPVSLLCNNAGVAMHGTPVHEISMEEWDWVIGVNIYGVVHGIRTFVPRMLERQAPAHIVNTASIGGFQVNPAFRTTPYSMTKFAVVALSEGLRDELEGSPVGVSVLAPAAVSTGLHLSELSRPDRLGGPYVRSQNHFMGDMIKDGATPESVAEEVFAAVEADRFYIFTHPETRQWLEARHERIIAGFDRADAGPGRAAAG